MFRLALVGLILGGLPEREKAATPSDLGMTASLLYRLSVFSSVYGAPSADAYW
jgi:hypothetical protein